MCVRNDISGLELLPSGGESSVIIGFAEAGMKK